MVPMPDYLQNIFPLAESLNLWKPMIAAVNGICVAGGFNHAMQCDIRIAADTAEFGVTEARWNQAAGWIHHLPRIIGLGNALELILWGDQRISAQRAFEIGFVNKVVPAEVLMPTAMEYAMRLMDLAPRAVRNFKERGNEATMRTYPGVGHSMTPQMRADLWAEIQKAMTLVR
jgi:enoyl-CoA hydratase